MGIFYSAVMDDPLDSGGDSRILEGSGSIHITGIDGRRRRMALIGHRAWCGACKSEGIIFAGAGVPDRRRLTDLTSGGAKQAVGGDLVACKCERPPRIIPEFGRRWVIKVDGTAEPSAGRTAAAHNEPPEDYDTHFVLTDMHTGQPLAGFAWGIETPDGEREGCTGADGKTDVICGHEGQSVKLNWVLQTEMGIRP